MHGCSKDCLFLIPFRLPQISCSTLSLNCFSSDSDNCPDVGIGPLLQFSHLLRAGPILLKLLFFPLVLFILPSFAWVYIFFSTGQVLLSTFSWCSAFTSVSEGVFLRDVLHVYLLLHHLVLLHPHPCSNTTMRTWGWETRQYSIFYFQVINIFLTCYYFILQSI